METGSILVSTAVALGVGHTIIGIDHSLPFIALSRARGWSLWRTLGITAVCGLGHVLSSVLLGTVGLGIGVAVERLEWIESTRGTLSAWLLIGFGLAYACWGWQRARRGTPHTHLHVHGDGTIHRHHHEHEAADHTVHAHAHLHDEARADRDDPSPDFNASGTKDRTGPVVLALFMIFVLGPCEVLIPLLMVPAFAADWTLALGVVAIFAVATVATMMAVVALGVWGLGLSRMTSLEKHLHTVAGLTIALSGLSVRFLAL